MIDDAIDRLVVGDEGDEAHRAAALRASERVDLEAPKGALPILRTV